MSERIVVVGGTSIGAAVATMLAKVDAAIAAENAARLERKIIELKAQQIDLPEVVLPESHRPHHRGKGERKRNRKNRWR